MNINTTTDTIQINPSSVYLQLPTYGTIPTSIPPHTIGNFHPSSIPSIELTENSHFMNMAQTCRGARSTVCFVYLDFMMHRKLCKFQRGILLVTSQSWAGFIPTMTSAYILSY